MKSTLSILLLILFFLLPPVTASEPTAEIHMNLVEYPKEGIVGHDYTIHNSVWFQDFITYYPFLYPNKTSSPHTFHVALFDNGRIYDVKSVTFYTTRPEDPYSMRRDVDFIWIPKTAGNHTLSIKYDIWGEVSEIREDNNDFTFWIYVYPTKKEYYVKFIKDNKYLMVIVALYIPLVIYYFDKRIRHK